jgi:BASS family bile acid:Na+ symporter
VKIADIATTLFPVWTVLFTGIALKSPQSFAWFTTEYFTGALAALMLSMGITLTPQDFVKVAARPNATLMQFTLCYGMMPLLALGLGTAFKLDPALMAGMVLVGSINGGQASNLCTYIARGNVALSVLMTTATTLGAIVMTPLLCKGLLGAVVPVDAAGIAKSTIQVRCLISDVYFSAPIRITCVYDLK